jgi:hypothetical protein
LKLTLVPQSFRRGAQSGKNRSAGNLKNRKAGFGSGLLRISKTQTLISTSSIIVTRRDSNDKLGDKETARRNTVEWLATGFSLVLALDLGLAFRFGTEVRCAFTTDGAGGGILHGRISMFFRVWIMKPELLLLSMSVTSSS